MGRILLTAFMLLAIVPLSIVSFVAVRYVERDVRQAAVGHLSMVADAGLAQVQSWLIYQQTSLSFWIEHPQVVEAVQSRQWQDVCALFSRARLLGLDVVSVALIDQGQPQVVCTLDNSIDISSFDRVRISAAGGNPAQVWVGQPDLRHIGRSLAPLLESGGKTAFLLWPAGQMLCLYGACGPSAGALDMAWYDHVWREPERVEFYRDAWGVSVMGTWRRLPEYEAVLLVEQPQEMAMLRQDDLATVLIASTLAVALLTTILAAVITRQLTQPIVQLTMSAVKIANGDLGQEVAIGRRDEIGILAQAFNIMTAELRSLYEGLEQKVAERTEQLTQANRQLRYQAMQLALSAEIGRVATSILDLDELLDRVGQLILDSYAHVYGVRYVAILLQDEVGEWVELHTGKGVDPRPHVNRFKVGGDSLIGVVSAHGKLMVKEHLPGGFVEVVVPLYIGSRVIGLLDLVGSNQYPIGAQDVGALESLGDQISVAIENARVYAAEHEAVERLSRLDHVRLASLSVGSRELATSLNNIIGFSRLILKGADGPLTDLQRADLVAIHKSGYQLLGLIDHVITLSGLETGTIQPEWQPVDLVNLLEEVLLLGRQRFIDVVFTWRDDRPTDLPLLRGDAHLLQQVFLGLLNVAVEQIAQNQVVLQAFLSDCEPRWIIISMSGVEWLADADEICARLAQSDWNLDDSSVGLALGKQIVAMHHGKMWVEFDIEYGWHGSVALPL